ncbi:hypothetical protein [Corynebacterium epidermidicanis]|uniref:Uncharacterized protein n=1 Tax=Corynebacterium epidermidicanis TaxID=1050174 RepID=A0A0G3GN81_9CORY|nr:hypothetical protein [Corynebacterium epidermidicanis]AKK02020.1 hypothetical protein CEPID_00630 [Corynebacterium epidermidicanis]
MKNNERFFEVNVKRHVRYADVELLRQRALAEVDTYTFETPAEERGTIQLVTEEPAEALGVLLDWFSLDEGQDFEILETTHKVIEVGGRDF